MALQLGSLSTLSDTSGFDWASEENAIKWKGQFVGPLAKVLYHTHPQFVADEESLVYVESLLIKLLAMITAKPAPTTVSDVEKRVSHTFPSPIDRWALEKAQKALKRVWKKSPMFLPVDKIHSLLKEVLHNHRLDDQVSLYIAAVLQFIAADILNLACNYVLKISHHVISCQDIKTAMCADTVLMDMFEQDELVIYHHPMEETSTNQTYGEVIKDLIMDEKQYLRDLQMITKVFRDLIQKHNIAEPHEIEAIFSNINEIVELTVTLIGSLEDTLEMTEDGNYPAVGSCFEELAEGEEFDVYDKYAQAVLSSDCRLALEGLLARKDVSEKLISSGKGFSEAVKFYLPKLLLGPIFHCANYFKYLEILMTTQTSGDDADALQQAAAMLTPLQNKIQMSVQLAGPFAKRKTGNLYPRCGPNRISRQQSLQKLSQIQASIVNWEGKDIASNSSEVVYEGKLNILIENRKRFTDRYVYLFDGMIIICKMNRKGSSALVGGGGGGGNDQKVCVKHLIRRVDVLDRKDSEDLKHTFELIPRDQPKIILKADSLEEKNNWMSSLVMLNTKSMLERRLDINLSKEETKHPLRFPPSERYKFAEPDDATNIVFEDPDKSNGIPLIKGATLVKLVERLTFHMHADPMFVKAFLTTYRSFSNPNELLELLIERFNIPDPEFSSDSASDSEFYDKKPDVQVWQDLKRFRKEYKQPVQFRVLNVLKHWVDEHFYDFEQDSDLLLKLTSFLETISGKNMKKWVDCISKLVQRRQSNEDASRDITFDFDRSPPEFEVHIEKPEPGWPELLTYHPIEIARQLTMLEFDYYRAVKPSELVDQAWMKEDKDKRSPNLLRMVRHTTMFTLYLEKLIVEAENMEERVCVIQRALEIMMVLMEYNNFNGVIAITSAMNSSSVHRLVLRIKDRIPNNLLKALEEASALVPDHFKIYWDKLRSLNPPCVPFFGQYQTNILFLEEGNPDFLQNSNLINFSKWRKVAEIISEIQQYQNQPYCLKTYLDLKNFLETLAPFPGMTENEISEYLWEKSVELEPRVTDTLRKKSSSTEVKPKWKNLNLKSPGIKPKNLPGKNHPNPLPRIRRDRNPNDNNSPLTSPVFQFSPSSLPPTPFATPSPAKADPVKAMVMLPVHSSTPPQLPPKPPRTFSGFSSSSSRPPIVSRQSSPPPPLPPRRDHSNPHLPRHHSSRSSFEIRSPPVSDGHHRNTLTHSPPPPPLPRHHHSDVHHQFSRPSPLNLRQTHNEGPSPSPSPLWSAPSPSGWSIRNGPPPYSTPTGPSPAKPDFSVSSAASRSQGEQHFNFSQNSISSSGVGPDLSPTSPLLPPRKPVTGSSGPALDAFQIPRDNYERVNEWLQSPNSSSLTTELLMP